MSLVKFSAHLLFLVSAFAMGYKVRQYHEVREMKEKQLAEDLERKLQNLKGHPAMPAKVGQYLLREKGLIRELTAKELSSPELIARLKERGEIIERMAASTDAQGNIKENDPAATVVKPFQDPEAYKKMWKEVEEAL